ncbi:MAG: threonine--tRNA ligase [Planctomycetota bacterium]|jgi:threonyl-tRNA synthetase
MKVELPDGSPLEVPEGATVADVARKIGPGLAKAALLGKIDGRLVDLSTAAEQGGKVEIVTAKSPEAVEVLRHSTGHVMAAAVKRVFGDKVKFAIGPAIERGFYYDFDLERTFTPEDVARIEEEMSAIVSEGLPFERIELARTDAIESMRGEEQEYKVELLEEIGDDSVSMYRLGEFTDLCRGPHLSDSSKVPAFKLLSIAGAYWRGDSERPMLQRIYGTAFFSKKELEEHLHLLEEAKKRDHRRLGRDLDLFSFHDEGPGFPFFHPKGMVVINEILDYWRKVHRREGYVETCTPIILREELWHQSGHWDHYRENMYFTRIDEQGYAVKPMNCPGNMLIYKATQHSYREFPMKVAELGLVHRHELSGVLHGLLRVRSFIQDDAHIFCLPEQISDEVAAVIDLCFEVYRRFGLEDVEVELSTRPDHSIGTEEQWEQATEALKTALAERKVDYRVSPGEGAFYGPKIDFHIRDCLRRSWQCGTIQADFSMPERFDLEYTAADGQRRRPVMIHRTVLGSLERFLAILIEHYAGALPFWLSPVQVVVVPITDEILEYAGGVHRRFREAGFRVDIDDRSETVGNKIRQAEIMKVPYMLVVGKREARDGTVSVRKHSVGDTGPAEIAEVLEKFAAEADMAP